MFREPTRRVGGVCSENENHQDVGECEACYMGDLRLIMKLLRLIIKINNEMTSMFLVSRPVKY